jgi:hypothetical protein
VEGYGLSAAIALQDVEAPELSEHAEFDIPPECEGDCAPYSGDLKVSRPAPLALCDPYFDAAAPIEMDEEGDIWISEPVSAGSQDE